jgi:branched-chain amino acid transport system substrate-binding protein
MERRAAVRYGPSDEQETIMRTNQLFSRRLMGAAVAAVLLTATAACGGDGDSGGEGLAGTDNTPTGEPIVIGADLDVTGPAAAYNKRVREGIDLAIEVVNRDGGVLDRPLKLSAQNSQSDPAKAPAAYNAMIDDGAVGAIGYVAAGIPSVKKIIEDAQLLTIAASVTTPGIVDTAPNSYLYSVLPQNDAYADVFCGAFKAKGQKKVALFHDDAPGVVLLVKAYKEAIKACLPDGFVVEESAPLDATDFSAAAARLKKADPDAILTASVGGNFQAQSESTFAQQMPDVPRYAVGAFDGQPEAWKVAQPGALEGLVVIRPITDENPREVALHDKLKAVAGDDADIAQMHALGYDSVLLIAEAIKKAGTADDPVKVNEAFQTIQGFKSTLGQDSFTLSFGKDKHVGADGACGLVLADFGADNKIAGLWDGYQATC